MVLAADKDEVKAAIEALHKKDFGGRTVTAYNMKSGDELMIKVSNIPYSMDDKAFSETVAKYYSKAKDAYVVYPHCVAIYTYDNEENSAKAISAFEGKSIDSCELHADYKIRVERRKAVRKAVTIRVEHVPRYILADDLEEIFAGTGFTKCDVEKINDKVFGFVEYSSERDARRAAITMQGTKVNSKVLRMVVMLSNSDKPKELPRSNRRIFVRNISYAADEAELKEAFKNFNPVECTINKYAGKSNGTGFVLFENEEDFKNALEAKITIRDRELAISAAFEK